MNKEFCKKCNIEFLDLVGVMIKPHFHLSPVKRVLSCMGCGRVIYIYKNNRIREI